MTLLLSLLLMLALSTTAACQAVQACGVAPESLQIAVQRNLRATVDTGAHIHQLHLPCGPGEVLVAAAWLPSRDRAGDYGPRVVTLRRSSTTTWALAFVTPGLDDSNLPAMKLFASAGRVLVLADLGDEGGSWGIGAYELAGTDLVELDLLDVGRPTDENDQSALESLMVTRTDGKWQVSFPETIVLRPNQTSREVVSLHGRRRIDFRLEGDKWRQVP